MSTALLFEIENGDFKKITQTDAVAHLVENRLKVLLGEHFLDDQLGVDWFNTLLDNRISIELKREEIYKCILNTPGVRAVRNIAFEVNPEDHTAVITYYADSIYTSFESSVSI